MTTKLIKIGNSKGIRIPKEAVGSWELGQELLITRTNEKITITPIKTTRAKWVEQMKKVKPDSIDEDWQLINNKFDEEEWTWDLTDLI